MTTPDVSASAVTPTRGPRAEVPEPPEVETPGETPDGPTSELERKLRQKRVAGGTLLGLGLLAPTISVTAALSRPCGDGSELCFGPGLTAMAVSVGSLPLVIAGATLLARSSRRLREITRASPTVVGFRGGAGLVWQGRF